MAAGFATIENDGIYREPTCIRTIVDSDNNVIYTSQMLQEVIYSETAARMTTMGLAAVMEDGTGKKHKLSDMPCAGKTGTTNQNKDGWFVGFTRYYTTSVWVGCDMPKEVEELKGSTYPGTIWNTFMSQLHEGFAQMDFLPYAQLSDEFLDAQEDEKNRYTMTDENGNGIPDEEEADGEDGSGEELDTDGTGDEDAPEENVTGQESAPDEAGDLDEESEDGAESSGEDEVDENPEDGTSEGLSDTGTTEGASDDENPGDGTDAGASEDDGGNANGDGTGTDAGSSDDTADAEAAGGASDGSGAAEEPQDEGTADNEDTDDDSVDERGYRG
jgi:membrane peptidoglycan carboxypeptidase